MNNTITSEEGISDEELAKFVAGSIWRINRDTWGDTEPDKIYLDNIAPHLDDTTKWKRMRSGDLLLIVKINRYSKRCTAIWNDKVVEVYINKHIGFELIKAAP